MIGINKKSGRITPLALLFTMTCFSIYKAYENGLEGVPVYVMTLATMTVALYALSLLIKQGALLQTSVILFGHIILAAYALTLEQVLSICLAETLFGLLWYLFSENLSGAEDVDHSAAEPYDIETAGKRVAKALGGEAPKKIHEARYREMK